MKLLVSPMNIEEAHAASLGGADIIDVKNPKEGSLGANFPWMIRQVTEAVGHRQPVSATIGDFDYKPGTASLAALGAAVAGAHYVKVGLYNIQTREEAHDLLEKVVRAVKDQDSSKLVVASAYSDYKRINSISPMLLPEIGSNAGVDVVMMDTGIKDGRSTFEFMDETVLSEFTALARHYNLQSAIAGTIKFEDIEAIKRINPDIVGIRGAVCGGDRTSSIKQHLVEDFKSMLGE